MGVRNDFSRISQRLVGRKENHRKGVSFLRIFRVVSTRPPLAHRAPLSRDSLGDDPRRLPDGHAPVLFLPPDNTRRHARFREVGLGVQSGGRRLGARAPEDRPAASRRSARILFFAAARVARRAARIAATSAARLAGRGSPFLRLEVAFEAFEAFEAFDRRCRRECVGSRRRSFFAAARARRRARDAPSLFKSRDASSNRLDDAREIPRRNSAVCDLRSESEADAEATAAAAAALSPPRPSESDAKREWHRATFSSASASSTETTASSTFVRFLFFRRVVVFAARDERRAAKARKRDGVLLFLLFPLERRFVEEHVTRLVVGVDARDHGEPSEAVVSQNTHARADRDAGFRDDATVRRGPRRKARRFRRKRRKKRRRAAAAEGSSPFRPREAELERASSARRSERRARLEYPPRRLRNVSPEPKRAPGVGSCRGAPRGLDDGVFVFVSGNHDIRRDIRRLRV